MNTPTVLLLSLLSLAPVARCAVPVDELLAKLPAPAQDAGAAILSQLAADGPDVVLEVARRLKPSDVDPTPAPRFALQGLTAMYGARPTPPAVRAAYASALLKAAEAVPEELKVLLLQDLRRVAADESVAGVAPYLATTNLYASACAVLQTVNTPSAHAALAAGLGRAAGPRAKETMLSALAASSPRAGRDAALPLLADPTRDLRIAAAQVVSRSANAADRAALRKAVDAAANKYERSRQLWSYLDFAARLGKTPAAAEIAREVLAAEKDSAFKSGALMVLLASGADAMAELKAALASEDIEYREAAAKALLDAPGESATAFILDQVTSASDPARKASAVALLAARKDDKARTALRGLFKDPAEEVRIAAIAAAGQAFGGDMLSDFIFLLGAGTPGETAAMSREILRMSGDNVVPMVGSAISTRPPAGKVALIGILEERKATAQRQSVFAAVKDADPAVRKAALKALAAVATPEDASALAALLALTAGTPDAAGVKRAVLAVGSKQPAAFTAALTSLMTSATPAAKADILDTYANVGGAGALAEVGRALNDPALRDAAVRTLARWPDAGALALLTTAAAGADKTAVLAQRGAADLLKKSTLPDAEKLAALKSLRKAAPGEAAAAPIISALGTIRTAEALVILAEYLAPPATREAASQAILALALDESGQKLALRGPAVTDVLTKVLYYSKDKQMAKRVVDALQPQFTENLALGRPARAEIGSEGTNTPEKAVDGNLSNDTGWWGEGHEGPRWWQVDLGAGTTFDKVRVYFHADGARQYLYTLNVSDNDKDWREIVDATRTPQVSTAAGTLHTFAPVTARYLRVWVHKNTANSSTHLREVQVFAPGKGLSGNEAPARPDVDGFTPTLRGNFAGWTDDHAGYYFNGETLVCPNFVGQSQFFTLKSYTDFHLKFDFKLTPHANNGVALFGNQACEIQILDDGDADYATLKPYQYHGSVYGVIPAARGSLKPLGEWNSEEIILKGRDIEVIVNGKTASKGNLDQALDVAEGWKDSYAAPHIANFRKSKAGPVGFMGHGEHVEFRNVAIKDLSGGAFTDLFNGKDLTGWRALVGNPETRKGMAPDQVEAAAAKLVDEVKKHWWVADGEIVTDGHGANLCTSRYYGDFEMTVDWKIQKNGDSGIYIRGCPQVQIWDPTNKAEWGNGADRGSGGLWNNTKEGRFPMTRADKPPGEWNTFRIRMQGDKVSIWLNDQLVVDGARFENYWAREKPVQPAEQIELQAHGNEVRFRNLRIREL